MFTKTVVSVNPVLRDSCFRWGGVHDSAAAWLNQCSIDLSDALFGELLFVLWSIWTERNNQVWNQKSMQALDVSVQLCSRLHEYRYHNKGKNINGVRTMAKWSPPSAGMCKINVDGAYFQSTGCGGWGFVIRDHTGEMLGGGAGPIKGLLSAEHAELIACSMAVEFAQSHAFYPAILEMDALEVKRQLLLTEVPNTASLGRLYEDVQVSM